MKRFVLRLLPGKFAVCRLDAPSPIPPWAADGEFLSITRTADELSIVCEQTRVPAGVTSEPDWRCFQLEGPIPFTEVGVLKGLLVPLGVARIGVFAVSTFDTDYVLVKDAEAIAARETWVRAGYEIR